MPVELLRRPLFETPPTNPHRLRDIWSIFKLGRHFPELDAAVQRNLHELSTRSAGGLLDHWFETDAINANTRALAPGSGYVLFGSTPGTTLAPKGAHIASLFCQHFAYKLPGGHDWHQERERAADLIFSTVESYAPNFRASVLSQSALSPVDFEEKLDLAGGDIFHGALGVDQPWVARPMLGCGDCRTPVKDL